MNADLLAVLEFWEREKGISRETLLAAVQEALVSAAKKAVGPARDLRVEIDQRSGDIRAFAKLMVSERVASKHDQISVFDARRAQRDGARVTRPDPSGLPPALDQSRLTSAATAPQGGLPPGPTTSVVPHPDGSSATSVVPPASVVPHPPTVVTGEAQIGDEVEIEVTPVGFGRIAAQYAKQALMTHIRRAEKQLIFTEFKDRVGDIVGGTVRRFERSDVILDLGRYEAMLPNRERVPTEEYQIGERIRCYVKAVEQGPHGPEIILSRADPNFVVKLFRLEVSEINDGTIEIRSIAREPGFRTKLAVWTRDEKVDPVGACVGLRGQRVKNIVRELNNEKVDIIRWDSNVRNFVSNALQPAKIKSFEIDEARKRVKVMVNEDQLSLAIGKRGQNARLTSKLTGWQVDIDAEHVAVVGFEEKLAQAVQGLASVPGISEEQAKTLVNSGWTSLEALLQADVNDLAEIPELGEQAGAILEAARAEASRRTLKVGETQVSS